MKLRGLHEHLLKIRLKTPPVDGATNTYLIHYLSKEFKATKENHFYLKRTDEPSQIRFD